MTSDAPYEFRSRPSDARDGWWIVSWRYAAGGPWEIVASVFGERRAEIVRDALSEEANQRV